MKKKEKWECKRCGKCCRFIVIPVQDPINAETEFYLDAHGIACDGKKIIIPAVCQYLRSSPQPSPSGGGSKGGGTKYNCTIHEDNFSNCRLGGEKECKDAQKAWLMLHPEG